MSFGFGFSLPAVRFLVAGYNPFNQNGPTLDLSFIGTAPSVTNLSDPNGFTLDADFIVPQYQIAAEYVIWEDGMGLVSKTFSQIITFTRASTATYFDATGTLQSAAIDVPRFDYNPSTLAAQGFLIEEARTNSIRNNTMQGAVAGTPGTLPTNWGAFTALTGLTRQIVGTGTENGITYIEIRLSGTPSAAGDYQIFTESLTQIAASSGQSWSSSFYYKLQAGSLTGVSAVQVSVVERDAAGAFLTGTFTNVATPSSTLVRGDTSRTLSNASTQRVSGDIRIILTGVAIDITLRIGLPQLELGAFATSVIPTTTTALTRSADVASVNTLSPWFNSASGTLYVEATTPPGIAGFPNSIGISDGTSNNRTLTYVFTNGFYSGITTGGVSQGNAPVFVTPTIGAAFKFAAAYNTNLLQSALNGTAGTPDTTINLPSGLNIMRIGAASLSSNFYNSHIQRITYYPRAFSQTELQTLTT
jgi:hypothetical protein